MPEFPNVDRYCELDLSPDGPIAQKLLSEESLRLEATATEIVLQDVLGPAPTAITPVMRNWYSAHIERFRKPALDEVNSAMQQVNKDTGVTAGLLERRLDQIEDQRFTEKRDVRKQKAEQNVGDYSRLEEARRDYAESSRNFELKRRQRKREPKMIGKIYFLAILFIGFFEALINFEAFSSLSYMTPAIALGSTVVVAILLALSSHLHGSFLAEFQFRFGDQRRPGDVWAAWRIFSLGTLALSVVLAAVWYARSNYLMDAILEAAIIGGTPPSWLSTVGGSLLLNLGVWIAGVIIAYLFHDSDPEFPALKKSRDKHAKVYRDLEKKLGSTIEREFRRIDAVCNEERSDAKSLDDSMKDQARYIEARLQFERLAGQDAAVLGILQAYQNQFVSTAMTNGANILKKDEYSADSKVSLSPAEYGALQIKLKFL